MAGPIASRQLRRVGAAVVMLTAWASISLAVAQSPVRVEQAVQRLGAWLDASQSGPAWKRRLYFDDLVQQIKLGEQANWDALLKSLQRLSDGAPGLEHPEFVRARRALLQWMIQWGARDDQGLGRAAEAAKADFRSLTLADVEVRRQRVRDAMRDLETFLADWPQYVQPWKDYLSWDDLQREVASQNPNTGTLRLIYERFRVSGKGGQYEPFARLREAIGDFGYVVAYQRSPERLKAFYERTLDQLAAALKNYQESGSTRDALQVGRLLGELRHTLLGTQYVAAVQTRYWKPNAFAQISDRLAGAGVNQTISRQAPVSETVRGTQIIGTAEFEAAIQLGFTPSARGGAGHILLRGQADSDNVAIRKKVRVYSRGLTRFEGRKPFFIQPTGLTEGPAVAQATTQSQITGVSHWLGLVRRIAGRVAEKTRPEGEKIASDKVERQIEQQMDEQSRPLVSKANTALEDKVFRLLRDWEAYPRWMGTSTTRRHLNLGALHVVPEHLAASAGPPPLSGFHDLAIRVHESLVLNAGTSVLGGKTLDRERTVELLQKFELEIPEELQQTDEPFAITFNDTAPLVAEFRGQIVHLALRGKSFLGTISATKQVTGPIKREMELSADYRFVINSDGSAVMERIGDIKAAYTSGEFEDPGAKTIKTVMAKKVDLLFKPRIEITAFELPGEWKKAGKMQMQVARADQGWLTLAWLQSGVAPASIAR